MIEVGSAQITPELRALFDPRMPAGFRCFAVIAGDAAGRIFTDDPIRPTWGAVQEGAFGTVYPAGALDPLRWHQLIAKLRNDGDVLVGLWPNDKHIQSLPPAPDYDGWTLDFTDRSADVALDAYLRQLPDGCELRNVDRQLFERSEGRDFYRTLYGSVEQALEKGSACFLMRGDEICCESYAYFAALGIIEIAISTREQYRGQGYATITCAHLIRECEAHGYQTYWNCARQNLVSAALARKLGYRTEKEYRLLAWLKREQ
ncbi:MAG: GNAT family N-acetyltransferase [Roseiflexaceae bacterium]